MTLAVATAIAAADRPSPDLAAEVVTEAMRRSGVSFATSVLLFLTGEFARHTQHAVVAASRAANCLQVAGCTATGVFTEQDWQLDRPAAAAMVITAADDPGRSNHGRTIRLALATHDRADAGWLADAEDVIGIVSSGATAQEGGRVWNHGKVSEGDRCLAELPAPYGSIAVSRGLRPISNVMTVTAVDGHELLGLDGHPPGRALHHSWLNAHPESDMHGIHGLLAALVDDRSASIPASGRYTAIPLVSVGVNGNTITLGTRVSVGTRLVWMERDAQTAITDTQLALHTALADLGGRPDFGIIFSCMGRGPYFFGQTDEDLACVKNRLPGMPFIGAYGSGEIADLGGGAMLLNNSTVLALFARNV